MAILDDLPVEIADSVATILRDDYHNRRSRKGLHGLCGASKKFHKITLPHLYYRTDTVQINVVALVKTLLLRNRDLAQFVQDINIQWYELIPSVEDLDALKKGVDRVVGQEIFEFEQDPDPVDIQSQRYMKSLVEVLLYYSPNIRTVEITVNDGLRIFDYEYFNNQRHKYRKHIFLPALKAVSAEYWDTEDGFNLTALCPLLAVSEVEKVHAFACNRFHLDKNWVFASVKELRLLNSVLDQAEMRSLLRRLPNLQHFEYETGSSPVTCMKDKAVCSASITQALATARKTLRTLFIDQRERSEFFADDDNRPVESLTGFTKLESIRIWQRDLTIEKDEDASVDDETLTDGFHVDEPESETTPFIHKLPKSLKTLSIMGADDSIKAELTRLAQCASDAYPNLLLAEANYKYSRETRAVFREAGIKLEWS